MNKKSSTSSQQQEKVNPPAFTRKEFDKFLIKYFSHRDKANLRSINKQYSTIPFHRLQQSTELMQTMVSMGMRQQIATRLMASSPDIFHCLRNRRIPYKGSDNELKRELLKPSRQEKCLLWDAVSYSGHTHFMTFYIKGNLTDNDGTYNAFLRISFWKRKNEPMVSASVYYDLQRSWQRGEGVTASRFDRNENYEIMVVNLSSQSTTDSESLLDTVAMLITNACKKPDEREPVVIPTYNDSFLADEQAPWW